MPAGGPLLSFEAFGVVGRLSTEAAQPVESLLPALPPGWRPAPDGEPTVDFELRRDGSVAVDGAVGSFPTADHGQALDALGLSIQRYLSEHAPEHVFIHAGAVAAGEIGIVVPGRSLSGKTTLIAELVGLGATYYSDEYAVVDPDGRIHPYPRPLTLRWDFRSERAWVPVAVPVERIATGPVRAGLIVVTHHRSGVSWRPKSAGPGAGALALVDNAVAARHRPQAVLAAARRVASGATVLVGDRGDASATARELLSLAGTLGGHLGLAQTAS